MIRGLLTLLLVGLAAVVGVSVVMAILGVALSLVGFLLFKVAPLILIGYVVARLLAPRRDRLTSGDREWLEP